MSAPSTPLPTPLSAPLAGGVVPFGLDGSVRLPHWGLMRARGADSAKFLHGQLTNAIDNLSPGTLRLAGFCSAKGRLQASFLVWRRADHELMLACHASVLPATLKRLSMFVLRAQCKLTDAGAAGDTAAWVATGLAGDTAARALAAAGLTEGGRWRSLGAGDLLALAPVDGVARAVWLAPADQPAPAAEAAPALDFATWQQLDVLSGVPVIEAATVDQFVPQMLNYELIGGVDFKKGCYPGQEVVARSQYRGTVKRRMFLFDVAAPAAPGQEVFHEADPGQPAGMVVNAAAAGAGSVALVEVKLATLGPGRLHLGAADGPALVQRALPYPVPLDALADA
jgi:tRNA-modifying protein YgfZ